MRHEVVKSVALDFAFDFAKFFVIMYVPSQSVELSLTGTSKLISGCITGCHKWHCTGEKFLLLSVVSAGITQKQLECLIIHIMEPHMWLLRSTH